MGIVHSRKLAREFGRLAIAPVPPYIACLKAYIHNKKGVSPVLTTNDVLTLAKAGFTAQQIAALSGTIAHPAQPVQQPAQPVQQPAQPVQQPAQPVQQPAQNDNDNDVTAVLAKLGVLTDAIQANGLLNAQQPKQQTADEILAAIIQPPRKDKE